MSRQIKLKLFYIIIGILAQAITNNNSPMIFDTEIKCKETVDSSNYSSTPCQIKSKYLGNWDRRSLRISLEDNLLELITEGSSKRKSYQLDQVNLVQDADDRLVDLQVPNGRKYQIKADRSVKHTLHKIEYYQLYKKMEPCIRELPTPHPKKLNYFATVRSLSYMQNYIPEHRSSIIVPVQAQKVYERCSSYIKGKDWQVDEKKGGLAFINAEKKSIITKMISYVVKRVLSTGSFMGISFPTFAMKPQTILETYCKCLGSAPLLLDNISNDPIERIKAFNAIILTLSLQFNDIQKPFNPCIGQTFQGEIGGYQIYAEQISHHPPITSFLLDGKNYVLHGSLELNASLGLNSAVGVFYGEVVVEFDDGGVVKGRMLSGALTGMILGETRFGPEGAVYSYDRMNQLVCTYEVKEKDILTGIIGKLKPKYHQKFIAAVDGKGKEKYQKFKGLKESEFEKIHSRIQAVWTSHVSYDDEIYFDYSRPENLPFKLTQNIEGSGEKLLQSDSSYRTDVKLRAGMKIEQSQNEKQRIEEEERRLRKLREKTAGMAQRNSID